MRCITRWFSCRSKFAEGRAIDAATAQGPSGASVGSTACGTISDQCRPKKQGFNPYGAGETIMF